MAEVTEQTPAAQQPAATVPQKKKSNRALWIILGVVIFLFVIVPGLVFAAGAIWLKNNASDKLAENAIEGIVERASGGQVDVDSSDGSFSVQSEDGGSSFSVGEDQKLPDDFPKNSIAYLDEKSVTFVVTSTNEGKKNWTITTTVDKSLEEARAFFEERIKAPGYENVSTYNFNDTYTFTGTNTLYNLSVTVSKSESDEDVNVLYSVTQT